MEGVVDDGSNGRGEGMGDGVPQCCHWCFYCNGGGCLYVIVLSRCLLNAGTDKNCF